MLSFLHCSFRCDKLLAFFALSIAFVLPSFLIYAEEQANTIEWYSLDYQVTRGDFNGDELEDLLLQPLRPEGLNLISYGSLNSESKVEHLFENTQSTPIEFSEQFWHSGHQLFTTGDFNGDGFEDLLTLYRSDLSKKDRRHRKVEGYVFSGSKDGLNLKKFDFKLKNNRKLPFLDFPEDYEYHAGDFNGDGKDDLFVQFTKHIQFPDDNIDISNANHYVVLSNKKGKIKKVKQSISLAEFSWLAAQFNPIIGDFNADERDDIFVQQYTHRSTHHLLTSAQNGELLVLQPVTIADDLMGLSWNATDVTLFPYDVNEDNILDLLRISTEEPHNTNTAPAKAEDLSTQSMLKSISSAKSPLALVGIQASSSCNNNLLSSESKTLSKSVSFLNPISGAAAVSGCPVDLPPITPAAPSSASVPSSNTTGGFTVNWSSVSFSPSPYYRLYQSTNGGSYLSLGSTLKTSWKTSGLSNGTYRYRVRACYKDFGKEHCGSYRYSNTATVSVIVAPPPPSAPSLSAFTAYANVNGWIGWTVSANASSFEVFKNVNGGSYAQYASYSGATSNAIVGLSNGINCFKVRGRNAQGYGGFSNVVCITFNHKPTTFILGPYNNQAFTMADDITVSAVASDTDSGDGISKVVLTVSGKGSYTVTSAPYSKNFGKLSVGSYTITATAYDNRGANQSVTSSFSVKLPNAAPSISPLTPIDNDTILNTQSIDATADASDSDGSIKQVEFKLDTGSWKVDTTFPYSYKFGKLSAGSHIIYYRSKDNENKYSSSTPERNIKVNHTPVIKTYIGPAIAEDSTLVLSTEHFNISDADSSTFTLYVSAGENYTVSGTTITPSSANYNGSLSVKVRVKDSAGAYSSYFDAPIDITPVNDAPIITSYKGPTIEENGTLALSLAHFNITDVDSSSYTLHVEPGNNYTVTGTTITSSKINYNGSLNVRVRVRDSAGADSEYFSALIDIIPAPLSSPSRISANITDINLGRLTLSWAITRSAHTFNIEEKENNSNWRRIKSNLQATELDSGVVIPVTIYFVNDLNNSQYQYRIQSCQSLTCSQWKVSNSVLFKPATPASIIVPSNSTNGNISISWASSSTATKYQLQESVNNGTWTTLTSTATAPSYSRTGRSNGSYKYQVRAYNTSGWGAYRSSVSVVVLLPPSPPSSLSASVTDIDSGNITLNWTVSSSAKQFNIDVNKNNTNWVRVKTALASTELDSGRTIPVTMYLLAGLGNGSYQYRIQSCNSSGCGSWKSSNTATVLLPPELPSSIIVPLNEVTDKKVAVSWANVTGADRYELQESSNNGTSWTTLTPANSGTQYIRNDGNYKYRITACNASGCNNSWKTSTIVTVKLGKPAAVTAITIAGVILDGSVEVSWVSSTLAVDYKVYRISQNQPDGQNNAVLVTDSNKADLQVIDINLDQGWYNYRVDACNSAGCTPKFSNDVNVIHAPFNPTFISLPGSEVITPSYNVTWGGGNHATYYKLQERKKTGDSWPAWPDENDNVIEEDTIFNAIGYSNGEYQYRIKACKTEICATEYFTSSETVSVYLVPAAPTSITVPSDVTSGRFSISWSMPDLVDENGYHIQENVNFTGWNDIEEPITGTSHTFVRNDGYYQYRVKASNRSGYGPYSTASASVNVDSFIPSAPTINDDGVQSSDSVGAIIGHGGVSGGTASYRIPITLPPGRQGMQPSVSLNYSSGAGNGIAGVGWSLSAGSAISRCGMTVAQDGLDRNVTYNASTDKLCLNGQRLVTENDAYYGTSGTVYRTELDSFVRVIQYGDINAENTYFSVEYKNNLVSEFGNTAISINSNQVAEGRSETITWAISKSHDQAGNNIIYNYNAIGEGEYQLGSIDYTGFGDNAGDRHITFGYSDRIKPSTSYLAGGKSRKTQRLTTIETSYIDDVIRRYTLIYGVPSEASSRSLLRAIRECDGADNCLPETTFNWQEHSPQYVFEPLTYTDETGEQVRISENATWLRNALPHGDVNGDGVRDWSGVFLNAEGEKTGDYQDDLMTCYRTVNAFEEKCFEIDFNFDGKTDSIRKWDNELQIKYSNGGDWFNTGITWEDPNFNDEILGFYDFNGDGFTDIAFKQRVLGDNSKLWIYYHTNDNNTPFNSNNKQLIKTYPTPLTSTGAKTSTLFPDAINIQINGDMDGNGTQDFMVFDERVVGQHPPGLPTPNYIIQLTPNLNNSVSTTIRVINDRIVNWNYSADFFFDLNGDNLPDWLTYIDDGLHYRMNNGSEFISTWQSLNITLPVRYGLYQTGTEGEVEPYAYPVLSKITMMDYDGDGREELLIASDNVLASSCSFILDAISSNWKCDNDLYTGFTWGTYNVIPSLDDVGGLLQDTPSYYETYYDFIKTEINASIRDDSARTFSAISFTESIDGSIVVATRPTGIIASASQRAVLDVTGDGLLDVVTIFGCRFTECEFNGQTQGRESTNQDANIQTGPYINRNLGAAEEDERFAVQDTLKEVIDGKGALHQWVYKPLSSDEYNKGTEGDVNFIPFYEVNHEASSDDTEYFYFASSMNVVAEYRVSNGQGGTNNSKYRYRDAMYNTQGRGFQGFKSIIVEQDNFTEDSDEAHRDMVSRTDFSQEWPLTGVIEQSCTWLASNSIAVINDNPECTNVLSHSITNSVYDENTFATAHFVAIDDTTVINYDLVTGLEIGRQTASKTFDGIGYGNVTSQTQVSTDEFTTYTTLTEINFTPDDANWWLTKFTTSTVTNSVSGTQATTVESDAVADKIINTVVNSWKTDLRKAENVTTTGDDVSYVTATVYNAYGLPSSVTKTGDVLNGISDTEVSESRTTHYTYTNAGLVAEAEGYFPYHVSAVSGNGFTVATTAQYNPRFGQPSEITQASGVVVTNEYDGFGRLADSQKMTAPKQYIRYYDPDANAPINAVYRVSTMSIGMPTQNAYIDELGRTIRTTIEGFNGDLVYQDQTFDSVGELITTQGPYYAEAITKPTVSYSNYDALGRVGKKETSQANGSTLIATYNYQGLVTQINANNLLMSRTYNSLNMLISTTDAIGGITSYAYDAAKNPITIEDANENKITAIYNALGHKTQVNDPNQGVTHFIYNAFSEVEKETDANNDVIRYDRDLLGRLTHRFDTGHQNGNSSRATVTASFVWDTKTIGLLTSESYSNANSTEFYYDDWARATGTTLTIDGATYATENVWDSHYDRPIGLKYPNGLQVQYQYNATGYLEKEFDPAENGIIYRQITAQDAMGNIAQADLADANLSGIYTYSGITGQMESSNVSNNASNIQHITYTYDDFGNLDKQTSYFNLLGVSTEHYGYDDLQRLEYSTRSIDNTSLTINYEYDGVGNLTLKSDYASQYNYQPTRPNAVASVSKINGAGTISFGYDGKGNMTSGDGSTLTYNVHNKPVVIAKSGTTSQLFYDASGSRYKQVVAAGDTTRTTHYIGKHYEVEVTANGVSSNDKWRAYISDIAIVSHDNSSGLETRFTHRDRLGSATTITDKWGYITAKRNFDPFGKPRGGDYSDLTALAGSAKLANNPLDSEMSTYRGFTDHEHLDEVELIHMNGRVYDYNLGRFLSVDPVIQADGNSQGINPYSYIMNNPLAGTDPTGYEIEIIITCGGNNPCGPQNEDSSGGTSSTRNRDGDSNGSPTSRGNGPQGMPNNGARNSMPSQIKNVDNISDLGSQGQISRDRQKDYPSVNPYQIPDYSQPIQAPDSVKQAAEFCNSMPCNDFKGIESSLFLDDLLGLGLKSILLAPMRSLGKNPDSLLQLNEHGGLNLFKWGSSTTTSPNNWKSGDFMLHLPNKGNPKANWKQNSGHLRQQMRRGKPIYDSYRDPKTGMRIPTGGPGNSGQFLNAERKLLESRGWIYDKKMGAYTPPSN